MLSLPPVPEGFEACVGVWSSIRFRGEQAGAAFFERFEQRAEPPTSTPSLSDDAETTTSQANTATASSKQKKKGFKDRSSISARVRKAIEDEQDLYKLLALDPGASVEDLKRQYKKLALVFHPDKKNANQERGDWPDPATMTDEEIKQHFLGVQNAFEILSDETTRKQYDSTLPFDDALPGPSDITPENFYDVCGAAFQKESKWSSVKPVPKLGDASTPIEEVKAFYKFWVTDFVSWRDFSNHGEFELEEAQDREERRWMQKENWKVVSKFVKQERARVLKFVTLAESKDPRINAERDAERQRREAAKKSRNASLMADKLKADEERRRKEEEARLAEEQAAKDAAERKRLEKKALQDIRKKIRTTYKAWCAGVLCEFTADDLQDFMVQCGMDWCQKLANELTELTADAAPEDHPDVCAEVARCIRRVMSEYINSRYKTSFTAKPAEPTVAATRQTREWSADELSTLSKALVKFPGGTPNRWVQIAKFLGESFTPDDVILQAKALNDARSLRAPVAHDPETAFAQSQKRIPEANKKVDVAPDVRDPSTVSDWTIDQQTALEKALAKYPPITGGNPQDRWKNVASEVPGRTAKECALRFREIREAIRSRK